MTKQEEFITAVSKMREAQREAIEKPTSANYRERLKWEQKVDEWINQHITEQLQLDLWSRSVKSSETAGAYNVTDETKADEESAP